MKQLFLVLFMLLTGVSLAQETKLTPTNSNGLPVAMKSVAISDNYAVFDGIMCVFVYEKDSLGVWTQAAKLVPDNKSEPLFGRSIDVSGNYLVIGGGNIKLKSGYDTGIVYIFKRTERGWLKDAKLASLDTTHGFLAKAILDRGKNWGRNSVKISGDKLMIKHSGAGSQIFRRSGDFWIQEADIDSVHGGIALSGNYAMIGKHIYQYDGTSWINNATLVPKDHASNNRSTPRMVALSNEYAVMALSSQPLEKSSGSVYVFKRDGENWVEEPSLQATEPVTGDDFGRQVSLFGQYMAIASGRKGRTGFGGSATDDGGAVYLFQHDGSSWKFESRLVKQLTGSGQWGQKLALSKNDLLVGTVSKTAYVYNVDSTTMLSTTSYDFKAKLASSDDLVVTYTIPRREQITITRKVSLEQGWKGGFHRPSVAQIYSEPLLQRLDSEGTHTVTFKAKQWRNITHLIRNPRLQFPTIVFSTPRMTKELQIDHGYDFSAVILPTDELEIKFTLRKKMEVDIEIHPHPRRTRRNKQLVNKRLKSGTHTLRFKKERWYKNTYYGRRLTLQTKEYQEELPLPGDQQK